MESPRPQSVNIHENATSVDIANRISVAVNRMEALLFILEHMQDHCFDDTTHVEVMLHGLRGLVGEAQDQFEEFFSTLAEEKEAAATSPVAVEKSAARR